MVNSIQFMPTDVDTTTRYQGERGDDYQVQEIYRALENGQEVERVRSVIKTRWTLAAGVVSHFFDDVLVLASRLLPQAVTERLEPWDLAKLTPYREEYLSGIQSEVAQSSLRGTMQNTSNSLKIGGNTGWGEYFKGSIDEIRIYNRALSATEIATDMNTGIVKSSPPKLLLGNQTLGSVSDSLAQGLAAAFQTTVSVTGQITSLPVDAGSASTKLIAGIYKVNNGHPGALLAQDTLSAPVAGAWNKVLLPATAVSAGTKYWVAILSSSGMLKFRDKVGSTAQPSETSTSTTL